MKKSALIFCSLFTSVMLSAQWVPVYTDPAKIYDDIDFPTSQDGFVLGHYSNWNCFILITSDAGLSWREVSLPPGNFNQLSMYSATSGYVSEGGVPGTILRTNDGFNSTVAHAIDASFSTIGLEVVNDSSGFYMNNDSHLRSFTNYGANYANVMDTLFGISAIAVGNASTVYVSNGNHLEKTVNGGASWFCVNSALPDDADYAIAFINADTGYYHGTSYGIWKTTDGGLSFQNVNNYNAAWLKASTQYCAAISGYNTICWSSDYGLSWTTESLGMNLSSGLAIAPGGDCYVTNSATGEIRKRMVPLSVPFTGATENSSVFPNPVTNEITLSKASAAGGRFVLFNAVGQEVMETEIPDNRRISLENLPAGIYYYRIQSASEITSAGIISKE